MNNITLTLTNWGELDLGGVGPIPLNFNLNDVRDISSRGGIFSKTIKLYANAHNNAILGPLFDVNTQFLTVNPQRIEPCVLRVDGDVVMEGIFQIRRIFKAYTNEDEHIMYDVILKSNNSDFYNLIDGKFLTDLNLYRYNHVHDKAIIMDSIRNGTSLYGYQYYNAYTPIVEYPIGSGNLLHLYEPEDFKPAVYIKALFDQIFIDAGFTYTFQELYDINFDKLIMTSNREKIVPALRGGLFRAGITQFNSYLTSDWYYPTSVIVSGGTFSFGNQFVTYYNNNNVIFDNDDYAEGNLFDPAGQYSTVLGEYVLNPNDNVVYFETNFTIDTWVKFNVDMSAFGYPSTQAVTTQPNLNSFPNQQGVILQNSSQTIKQKITAYLIAYDINDNPIMPPIASQEVAINEFNSSQAWDRINVNNFTNTVTVNVAGDFLRIQNPTAHKVKVVLRDNWTEGTYPFQGFYWNGNGYLGDSTAPGAFISVGDIQNEKITTQFGFDTQPLNPFGYFKNGPSENLSEGVYIDMANVVSSDVKQSDFLVSLIRMYNLYITDDKQNENNLIIKTRDKFYADGQELNWNNKVDIKTLEIDILSNSQTKIKNFEYTEDSNDTILEEYKNTAILGYGALRYTFYNQFIKSSSAVKPLFSTAALQTVFKKNIPLIPSRDKTDSKILSVGQLYSNDTYFTYRVTNPTLGLVLSTEDQFAYRHVGHFYPNSFEPKEDINFGVCEYYSHNFSTITDNNLFNRFYRTQYDIFENGYMLRAKFKLNYLDISKLNMDERIFINNAWWNINRIVDFDLNSNGLTEVELISADATNGEYVPNHNLLIATRLMDEAVNTWSNLTNTTNKMSNTSQTEVYGKGNKVDDNYNSIIVGDFNYVNNKNGLVIGSSNIVEGSGIIALGSFNKTLTGKNKIFVNGLVEMVDLVDAVTDQVLNPFGATIINIIDAGTDSVLPYGSDSNIHLYDAN